eukprot:5897055-Pleurochrysis_carterae.AAC.1
MSASAVPHLTLPLFATPSSRRACSTESSGWHAPRPRKEPSNTIPRCRARLLPQGHVRVAEAFR